MSGLALTLEPERQFYQQLPDDPITLKAMVLAREAENARLLEKLKASPKLFADEKQKFDATSSGNPLAPAAHRRKCNYPAMPCCSSDFDKRLSSARRRSGSDSDTSTSA